MSKQLALRVIVPVMLLFLADVLTVKSLGQSISQRVPTETRSDLIQVELASSQSTYRINDPIMISVTFRNASAEDWQVITAPPTWLVRLVVFDANGNRMTQRPAQNVPGGPFQPIYVDHPPGSVWRLIWRPRVAGPSAVSEFDLRAWGYYLDSPGIYRIQAIPTVRGQRTSRKGVVERFASDGVTINSNTIQITIVP